MELSALLTLFMAALVLMIKTGPYMMALISLCSEGKWRSALSFWVGYAIVAMVLYYILLSSFTLLPQGFGLIFIFLKSAAAIIFIYMGMTSLSQNLSQYKEDAKALEKKADKGNVIKSLLAGGVLCLSNPYEIVWVLAVIPSLMQMTSFTFVDITLIFWVTILANIIIQSAYCIPLLMAHNFITPPLLKKIKLGSAIALILIGIYIFITIFTREDLTATNLISLPS